MSRLPSKDKRARVQPLRTNDHSHQVLQLRLAPQESSARQRISSPLSINHQTCTVKGHLTRLLWILTAPKVKNSAIKKPSQSLQMQQNRSELIVTAFMPIKTPCTGLSKWIHRTIKILTPYAKQIKDARQANLA